MCVCSCKHLLLNTLKQSIRLAFNIFCTVYCLVINISVSSWSMMLCSMRHRQHGAVARKPCARAAECMRSDLLAAFKS